MSQTELGTPLFKVLIKYEPDIVSARQKMRRLAEHLGFDTQDVSRLSTTVSELARNVFQYVGEGALEFFFVASPPQQLNVRISDRGQGIAKLETILAGTYTSATGLGIGITGSRKLMDRFEVTSSAEGTTIVFGKRLSPKAMPFSEEDLSATMDLILARKNENAFEEIQGRNHDLLAALEQLRASQAKSRFLSNMSHEIRTPLGIIMGFTELAMESDVSDRRRFEYLQTVKDNAVNLNKLLGDILDMAKVEAERIEIERRSFQ